MLTTFVILFAIFGALLLFNMFLLHRNNWVYKKRIEILNHDYKNGEWSEEGGFKNYSKLPSYTNMLMKFWVWDVNKFLKG